jgi:hypothetical protein
MLKRLAVVACASLVPGVVGAAPCHDVLGTWDFTLSCGQSTTPHFGTRTMTGEVTLQDGCVFVGTLLGYPWVGVLSGTQNRRVTSDFNGAKTHGQLEDRRGGRFREMSMIYTYDGSGASDPPTACTGTGTRR